MLAERTDDLPLDSYGYSEYESDSTSTNPG